MCKRVLGKLSAPLATTASTRTDLDSSTANSVRRGSSSRLWDKRSALTVSLESTPQAWALASANSALRDCTPPQLVCQSAPPALLARSAQPGSQAAQTVWQESSQVHLDRRLVRIAQMAEFDLAAVARFAPYAKLANDRMGRRLHVSIAMAASFKLWGSEGIVTLVHQACTPPPREHSPLALSVHQVFSETPCPCRLVRLVRLEAIHPRLADLTALLVKLGECKILQDRQLARLAPQGWLQHRTIWHACLATMEGGKTKQSETIARSAWPDTSPRPHRPRRRVRSAQKGSLLRRRALQVVRPANLVRSVQAPPRASARSVKVERCSQIREPQPVWSVWLGLELLRMTQFA